MILSPNFFQSGKPVLIGLGLPILKIVFQIMQRGDLDDRLNIPGYELCFLDHVLIISGLKCVVETIQATRRFDRLSPKACPAFSRGAPQERGGTPAARTGEKVSPGRIVQVEASGFLENPEACD
jgi:hypothetical protein